MPQSSLEAFQATAKLLRPVLKELVFVGGAVTSLLVTDEGGGTPRPTLDVDAIAKIHSDGEYVKFGERLRQLGFSEDSRKGAPVCRWVQNGAVLDLMPLDEAVLGFSNRWYQEAIETAVEHRLEDELAVRIVTAPYFLATKLEAFHGRGNGDFAVSHDLEDVIFVIDGCAAIAEEVRAQRKPIRDYLRVQFGDLLKNTAFLDALPGYLLPDAASQERLRIVLKRIEALGT